MKLIYPAILAAAALVGLAAFAPSLAGRSRLVHHMTVWLPGGGTETISYTRRCRPQGDHASRIRDWLARHGRLRLYAVLR